MKSDVIAIGCDHTGVFFKNAIITYLKEKNYKVIDCGTNDVNASDYPDFAKLVGKTIINKTAIFGIIICGTGIGISIAANKIPGIRAALCYDVQLATLARKHNDANVLALGARITAIEYAIWIIDAFLNSKFEGARHQKRVNKIEWEE